MLSGCIKSFCEALKSYDGSHDITHALKTAYNAYHIANNQSIHQSCNYSSNHSVSLSSDYSSNNSSNHSRNHLTSNSTTQFLSVISAILHDTYDNKYVDKTRSLKLVQSLLEKKYAKNEVNDIIQIISNISYTKLKQHGVPCFTKENIKNIWRIVSDSDMFEALGAVGIIRTFMYQGKIGHDYESAFQYISNSLRKCVDHIENAEALREAYKRLDTMNYFISIHEDDSIRETCTKFMKAGRMKIPFDIVVKRDGCTPIK